jgi:integrase
MDAMTLESKRISINDRVKIFQRGVKKIWQADFHKNGKHCLQSLKTSNQKVARERAMKLEVSLIDGTHRPTPSAITVPTACDDHISFLRTEGRSERTIEKYEGIYKTWNEFLTRQHVRYLHQYTPTHYDRYRAERAAVRSAGTVYDDSVLIKHLFRWAKSRKLVLEDPLAGVRNEKPELQTKFCPMLVQVNAILAAAPQPLQTQWAALAFSGLRAGELQRLRVEDVDLEGNWINVISRKGAKTKTGKSRRVPIHPRLRAILAEMPRTSREHFFTYSGDPADLRPIKLKRLNDRLRPVLPKRL